MQRQYQLDGIRGIAILMVMMLHSLLLPVGWIGVDLFFALSGFLITRILFESRLEPNYWQSFYIKRAGRILPPLVLLFGLVFMISGHKSGRGMLGYALFLGDYLNTSAYAMAILFPLWSLAIEEHFYMVWPIAVRGLSRTRLAQLLMIVLIVEPIARVIFTGLVADVKTIRYFTPFRLDAIAAGSLLALMMGSKRGIGLLRKISPALLAGSVVCYGLLRWGLGDTFTPDSRAFNAFGYSLVALGSFGLLAHALIHSDGRLASGLSFRPLVFLGEISYGLYLFHQVIRAATKALFGIGYGKGFAAQERWLFVPDLFLSIVVCTFLYRCYEKPLIQLSRQRAQEWSEKLDLSVA